jgi:hypothetical protein
MITESIDWVKEKLYNLKTYAKPGLIVTHPLRTFLFFLLVGPLLLGFFIIGVTGIFTLLFSPFAILSKLTKLNFSEPMLILKFIVIWILGFAVSVVSFNLSGAGLSIYCTELFYSTILLFKGKLATGKIIKNLGNFYTEWKFYHLAKALYDIIYNTSIK